MAFLNEILQCAAPVVAGFVLVEERSASFPLLLTRECKVCGNEVKEEEESEARPRCGNAMLEGRATYVRMRRKGDSFHNYAFHHVSCNPR